MKPVNQHRIDIAYTDKQMGRRAYSDAFDHIIINVHGCVEHGIDLTCAVQLMNDLQRAIQHAAIDDEKYINLHV